MALYQSTFYLVFISSSGHFGGAQRGLRLPECQSFVPVLRKQAEAAVLHQTVPLNAELNPGLSSIRFPVLTCCFFSGSVREMHQCSVI